MYTHNADKADYDNECRAERSLRAYKIGRSAEDAWALYGQYESAIIADWIAQARAEGCCYDEIRQDWQQWIGSTEWQAHIIEYLERNGEDTECFELAEDLAIEKPERILQ